MGNDWTGFFRMNRVFMSMDMRAPSKAKAIKLDNPAQAKPNQQPETELHILGGNE